MCENSNTLNTLTPDLNILSDQNKRKKAYDSESRNSVNISNMIFLQEKTDFDKVN